MSKTKNKKRSFFYKHADIHTMMISLAVVMCWRGAWGLMDVYIFPGNNSLSLTVSIVFGLVLLFILDSQKVRDIFIK